VRNVVYGKVTGRCIGRRVLIHRTFLLSPSASLLSPLSLRSILFLPLTLPPPSSLSRQLFRPFPARIYYL